MGSVENIGKREANGSLCLLNSVGVCHLSGESSLCMRVVPVIVEVLVFVCGVWVVDYIQK